MLTTTCGSSAREAHARWAHYPAASPVGGIALVFAGSSIDPVVNEFAATALLNVSQTLANGP
jgi:hypothetical protein